MPTAVAECLDEVRRIRVILRQDNVCSEKGNIICHPKDKSNHATRRATGSRTLRQRIHKLRCALAEENSVVELKVVGFACLQLTKLVPGPRAALADGH